MKKKQNKILLGFTVVAIALSVSLSIPAAVQAGAETLHSWDTQIQAAKRFVVLVDFNNAAVLDKETGLVWEQSPDAGTFIWFRAQVHCYELEVGGRKGWRLPTIEQLASLVDSTQSNPALPSGHPFANVQSTAYWSATTLAGQNAGAWFVDFHLGNVSFGLGGVLGNKDDALHAWCVRGEQGYDGHPY
jgi:hypothetical protein